ncbi:YodC family protein [Lelliottia nimipressuralis]|uniref:DUF2158 domain-containing protein n=1 Tax=Lelliottia nimipressuralis TaxID=69220 RepID=A0ABD4KBB3_9ENTR|nr:DUF2158 domain-containing protein [Lelliottia nimipressuralis]MBF4179099.1 DUF2158 domain-containing protein [Lelliottia nimipressuralis]
MSKEKERKAIYKTGDVVYLVTGGPSMSVAEAIQEYEYDYVFLGNYRCQWFAGKKLEQGIFPEESLTNTNPKP